MELSASPSTVTVASILAADAKEGSFIDGIPVDMYFREVATQELLGGIKLATWRRVEHYIDSLLQREPLPHRLLARELQVCA